MALTHRQLMDIATYISTRRTLAEMADVASRIDYSPVEGLDICTVPGCVYFRCKMNLIDSASVFWSLAGLLMNRLGFMDWDYKVEVFAPTFNIPMGFPEEWEQGTEPHFWCQITTKSRPQFTTYRGN